MMRGSVSILTVLAVEESRAIVLVVNTVYKSSVIRKYILLMVKYASTIYSILYGVFLIASQMPSRMLRVNSKHQVNLSSNRMVQIGPLTESISDQSS